MGKKKGMYEPDIIIYDTYGFFGAIRLLKQTTIMQASNTMPATRRKEMVPRTLPIITAKLVPVAGVCSELVIDVVSGEAKTKQLCTNHFYSGIL